MHSYGYDLNILEQDILETEIMKVDQLYLIKVMSNKKEIGNKLFTQKKYEEAIAAYKQYVSEEHPDNKNTYINIALCLSKMSNVEESNHYARKTIEIDPQYSKAYYRLFTNYKELPNQDYNVFINAINFCKCTTLTEQTIKEEVEKNTIPQYKKRIMYPIDKKQIIDPQFLQILKEEIKNPGLQDKWTSKKLEQDRWQEILTFMIQKDYQYGLNQAYNYINYLPDTEKKDQLRLQLQYAKRSYQFRLLDKNGDQSQQKNDEKIQIQPEPMIIQSQPVPTEEQKEQPQKLEQKLEVEAEDSNLFADSEEDKIQMKNQVPQKIKLPEQSQTLPYPTKPLLEESKPLLQESKPLSDQAKPKDSIPTVFEEKIKKNEEPIANLKEQLPQNLQKQEIDEQISTQTLQSYYSSHFLPNQKTKDVFQIFNKGVIGVLSSQNTKQFKQKMLVFVKQNVKKFALYVKSFSQTQQLSVFNLLKQHNLHEFIQDFVPKYKSV